MNNNPAATGAVVEDVQSDNRWMDMVNKLLLFMSLHLFKLNPTFLLFSASQVLSRDKGKGARGSICW